MQTGKRHIAVCPGLVALIVIALGLPGCKGVASPPPAAAPSSTAVIAPSPSSTVAPTPLPYESLQLKNDLRLIELSPRPSQELQDNGIGSHLEDYARYGDPSLFYMNGFKSVRILCLTDFWAENGMDPKTFTLDSVPQYVDEAIDAYASHKVNVVLTLWLGAGLRGYQTTFQSREELDRYSEYVRFVVSHFKGRVPYYEIWNEPGAIAVRDYAELVRTAVPIIRQEDPQARIIIGAIPGSWEDGYPGYGPYQRYALMIDYLNELLRSGVAPMVDGISWHAFYGNIPTDPYYQDYPRMLQGIKDLAASQGFTGEYFADELLWSTVTEAGWAGGPPVSEIVAAKYYTRAITLHRGFGVHVTVNTFFIQPDRQPWVTGIAFAALHNLADTLAGAQPLELPVSVASEASHVSQYAFSLPDGGRLVALWTNGTAVDEDPGVSANLTVRGSSAQRAVAIDVLHAFQQELVTSHDGEDLIISDFLLKDYPIFIRLSP